MHPTVRLTDQTKSHRAFAAARWFTSVAASFVFRYLAIGTATLASSNLLSAWQTASAVPWCSSQVMKCPKRYVHDWRSCPFAHPTENARRRDPREVRYMPVPCPDYKRGLCLMVHLLAQFLWFCMPCSLFLSPSVASRHLIACFFHTSPELCPV